MRPQIDAIQRAGFRASRPGHRAIFETFQDAEDEYVQKPLSVYDNVLAWKALNDLASAGETPRSGRCRKRSPGAGRGAQGVDPEIWTCGHGAVGAGGAIFAATVSAAAADFMDVPAGLAVEAVLIWASSRRTIRGSAPYLRLAATSAHYAFSYADKAWGLPGSYRRNPFTTSWSVADHLRRKAGRARALKVLTVRACGTAERPRKGSSRRPAQPDQGPAAPSWLRPPADVATLRFGAQFCTDRNLCRPTSSPAD